MMKLRTRAARRRLALRRDAARLALDGTGEERADEGTASEELIAEIESMRSLTRSLEQLSPSAWASALPPESANSSVGMKSSARSWKVAWATAAVAACLAAAFFVGALSHPFLRQAPKHVPVVTGKVTLSPLAGQSSKATAVAYMTPRNRMVVRVHNLPRSPHGTFYELWLMTSPSDLVPVTSFKIGSSGAATLALVLPDSPTKYKYLDISVQTTRAGTAISPNSVLRGRLS